MWKKLGMTYFCKNNCYWGCSHTTHPIVDSFTNNNTWRIYFSSRDKNNQSRTSFIDVEPENPSKILYEHPVPILELGGLGEFDEFGIVPTCIISTNNKIILYYIGLSVKKSVPFENFIGAAISEDGIHFQKINGPILGKDFVDPLFIGSLYVFPDAGFFRGYYMSGVGWETYKDKPEPKYCIKYAESNDAIKWEKKNQIAIGLENKEAGICQASVLKDENSYKMWYCYRNMGNYREDPEDSYKIGYAESNNGTSWKRINNFYNLNNSSSGWDSAMVCYPWVFEYKNKKWMVYNGNGFGATGLGFAIWEEN